MRRDSLYDETGLEMQLIDETGLLLAVFALPIDLMEAVDMSQNLD